MAGVADPIGRAVDEIRSLKVQGARNVARRAIQAIRELVSSRPADLESSVRRAVERLALARPTEPAMRDALTFVLRSLVEARGQEDPYAYFISRLDTYERELEEMVRRIAEYGARRIPDGGTVITHCHSSELMAVFRRAREEGKDFTVIVTETRPRYQGKITARELLEMGVKVVYVVDSAAYYFMRDVDVYMTGADAITSDGYVVNKIGTALIALAANRFNVPYYVAASTLKFDPVTMAGFSEPIEERDPQEVIDPAELPGAEIRNPAFDATPPELVDGIITEMGVYHPQALAAVMVSEKHVDERLEEVVALFSLLKRKGG